jgi:hypothetical protein
MREWIISRELCQILQKCNEILTIWLKYPHFSPVLRSFSGKGGPAGQVTSAHGPGNRRRKRLWKTHCALPQPQC